MENTKKSLLKWSDVFYVYEKIREIESGKESLGFVAGSRVVVLPADVYYKRLQDEYETIQRNIELGDQNTRLLYKIEELKNQLDSLQTNVDDITNAV